MKGVSSSASPTSWSGAPERASGFYIPGHVESALGRGWPEQAYPAPAGGGTPWAFYADKLQNPLYGVRTREAFHQAWPDAYLCLDDPLDPGAAQLLGTALGQARWRRQRRRGGEGGRLVKGQQQPSLLTDFVCWLESRAALAFHRWLVGHPLGEAACRRIQVEVVRLQPGQAERGSSSRGREVLVAIYDLGPAPAAGEGGELFLDPLPDGAPLLHFAPRSNNVFVYRAARTRHRIEAHAPAADGLARHLVICRYEF